MLVESGRAPAAVLRRVRALLAAHQDLAIEAFHATRHHRFPGTLDRQPHLWGEMFQPLLDDYAVFRRVHVDDRAGTVVWPNGADLSPRMLYEQAKVSVPS